MFAVKTTITSNKNVKSIKNLVSQKYFIKQILEENKKQDTIQKKP